MFRNEVLLVNMEKKKEEIDLLLGQLEAKLLNVEDMPVLLNGVDNVSRTDAEHTLLYMEQLIENCGVGFSPFVNPVNNVDKLLKAFHII